MRRKASRSRESSGRTKFTLAREEQQHGETLRRRVSAEAKDERVETQARGTVGYEASSSFNPKQAGEDASRSKSNLESKESR